MGKIVRLQDKVVVEILPESTYELGVKYWYGKDFSEQCVEAPDNVVQGMKYETESKTFYTPEPQVEEEPIDEIALLKQQVAEQKALINAMLGVTE